MTELKKVCKFMISIVFFIVLFASFSQALKPEDLGKGENTDDVKGTIVFFWDTYVESATGYAQIEKLVKESKLTDSDGKVITDGDGFKGELIYLFDNSGTDFKASFDALKKLNDQIEGTASAAPATPTTAAGKGLSGYAWAGIGFGILLAALLIYGWAAAKVPTLEKLVNMLPKRAKKLKEAGERELINLEELVTEIKNLRVMRQVEQAEYTSLKRRLLDTLNKCIKQGFSVPLITDFIESPDKLLKKFDERVADILGHVDELRKKYLKRVIRLEKIETKALEEYSGYLGRAEGVVGEWSRSPNPERFLLKDVQVPRDIEGTPAENDYKEKVKAKRQYLYAIAKDLKSVDEETKELLAHSIAITKRLNDYSDKLGKESKNREDIINLLKKINSSNFKEKSPQDCADEIKKIIDEITNRYDKIKQTEVFESKTVEGGITKGFLVGLNSLIGVKTQDLKKEDEILKTGKDMEDEEKKLKGNIRNIDERKKKTSP